MSKKSNFLSCISPALEKKDHLGCYKIIIITNDQFHFFLSIIAYFKYISYEIKVKLPLKIIIIQYCNGNKKKE